MGPRDAGERGGHVYDGPLVLTAAHSYRVGGMMTIRSSAPFTGAARDSRFRALQCRVFPPNTQVFPLCKSTGQVLERALTTFFRC